jgi:hypothetical protein
VRIVSSDSLSAIGIPGYITAQYANIVAVNDGAFTWLPTDVVLVDASDGFAFFTISSDFTSLNILTPRAQQVVINLTAAQIKGMYAAPVFILGAPAAGTVNLVTSANLNVIYGTTQYTAGGAIAVQYKNTVNGGGVAATGTIAAATLNAVTANTVLLFPAATSIALVNATAQPLYLSNATQAFASGDSTAILTVNYQNLYVV